jgi:hypothetical protein
MDKKLAETLKNMMENNGEEAEIYEDYSGRAMYGKTTTGLVIDHAALLLTVIIADAADLTNDDPEWGPVSMFENTKQLKMDNMGTQTIIY